MRAQRVISPAPIETSPLVRAELPIPEPDESEILIHVAVCGICHTDLHVVEGDLGLPRLPVTPGHQIVGIVERTGAHVSRFRPGDRVGVPWLHQTCGTCAFCRSGRENLCDTAAFTGYHVDGGFAEYVKVKDGFAYPMPPNFSDDHAAPLLCAGVIGFRALRLSNLLPGQRVGLYGFGASAHIAIQIVRHWGCEAYVFTRSDNHRALAEELGASWTGGAGDRAPHPVESAVIFAPAGTLVPVALRGLRKGGTIALAGIHMSPLPQMDYSLLYEERTLRSVAHSTRQDVNDLLHVAAQIPIRTEVKVYPLDDANSALKNLKQSVISGSGVLVV
jgi:propanol-preferring alcohol dehydrogenase